MIVTDRGKSNENARSAAAHALISEIPGIRGDFLSLRPLVDLVHTTSKLAHSKSFACKN